MDSVSFPSPQVVCTPDTVSFFFRTGLDTTVTPNLPFSNTDIHVDLPAGFKYVDIVYTESVPITKVPAVNINSSNPDDLIFSFNGFMLNPYTTLFELKLVVEPSCGASPSSSSAFVTKGGTTISVSDTITTPLIQVDEPYLVFQGLSNTTNSNASIDLTRLAVGQKFMRCFKVNYTSLISSIGELTVKVANDNNFYSFDWVTPGVTKTIVNDTVIYKFDAAFFTTIGDGDGVIEPGENFTFCDSVTVLGNCNSQNSNIKVDYVMSWGCGGFNCQNVSIAAEGVISLSPTNIIRSARPDLDIKPNLCDTCGSGLVKYGFQMINNTVSSIPTGGFLTNMKFEFGTSRWPFSIASNPILDSTNHCFDSVRINGVVVPHTMGANSVIEIKELTSFSGTGLASLDGDGFYNDLATGDTLVFELFGTFYANKHDTSALIHNLSGGNNDAQPDLIDAVRGAIDITYYDECGGNEKEERINSSLYNHLNPTTSTSSIFPDFFDNVSYTLNMSHGEWNHTTAYDCDSALRQTIVILPKDVSLDPTSANPFSYYPSNSTDSVVYWVEKDGPGDIDTLYIYYNTKGEYSSGGSSRGSSVQLRYNCSGGLCPEADSLRTIAWYQNYICINDAGAECYKTAMFRGKRLIRFHCDLPPQGLSLRTFDMERTTFGYTDSTETTKVDRTTPGIALRRAQVADTVKLTLKGVINNATLDSAHARFSYHTQQFQGGIKPVFRIDDVNSKVTIYDASTTTHHTFRLNAPGLFSGEFGPQQAGATENYDFQWNLSTYKDSIGGGYQFTGANTTASSWDSIIMEVYMIVEDNTYSGEFQIDPFGQMIEFPEDTATQCDIYGTLFSINQSSVNIYARASNTFGSCLSEANTIEFRTSSQDRYPNEYKRNEQINEIRYTWDPTYFDDPDSVQFTYYWRNDLGQILYGNTFVNRNAQYTQTGNTIVIPMEKSVNINVLPENWYWGYVNIYQTPTCAIKDSMPIKDLGLKAEMDITRFTNNNDSTYVLTQYDSSFNYYGSASTNILVDKPTPFNITSSPIVTSTSSDSVCWDVSYTNVSFTDINNTWMDFNSDSIFVTSVVRIDDGSFSPQTIYTYGANGMWIQMDTINSTETKTYRVCAQYSSCQLDSIVLTGGWNCNKYPTDPVSGYSPTAYTCEHNQQTMSIYIEELFAKLQVRVVNSTPMPIDLCDTLNYDVQIANIDLTSLKDLVFSAILPSTSNLSVNPGSTSLLWNYDGVNTTEVAIADPVRIGDSLAWDLTGQFSSSVLPNFEAPNDSNYALIRVSFNTNCVTYPEDAITFKVQGERGCDKDVISRAVTGTPFKINGLLPQVNRLTDIQIYLDTIEACDTATQVDLSFFNIFTKSTRGSEIISVTLPASFDISGNIYNGHRDSFLLATTPTNVVTGNLRTLEWQIKSGMPTASPFADSLSFSFSIVPITDVTCSIDTLIEAKVFERYTLYCVTDSSVPCEVIYNLDETRKGFTVTKGDLTLNNISTILDGCNDSLDINFGFTNNGTTIANGTTTKFKLYVDVNGDGVLDATDPIFDSIIYTDSIPGGTSGTINHKALASSYAGGEICNLIVLIDSASSCICDSSTVSLPVEINMNLVDSVLCGIDTLSLGVCAGTGNYAARTYRWYDVDGMGRQLYLSDTTSLNPSFNPPPVTTATIFRFAVQVNRGGCISEDTISMTVKASPLQFDVMDDTICETDCITLATASPQAGITYNVFDGLGSWLGTLPYNTCPTSTSTYYFEANDSIGGCAAIRDTAVITVVGKLSPGISSTVAGCGIGCTINLFDTLGGAPDTTGTWTDPSGNPFGTGHNVTFDANTDPVGIYTYTISNMPCADTLATVTMLSVTDTVPVVTNEDTPITVGAPSIGGAGPIATIDTTNGPSYGTVTTDPVTGTITYTPDTNYVGFDTVSIIVCYTAGNCDTTVLTITVLPVMDTTPVSTMEDTPFTLCPGTDSTTSVRNLGSTTVECGPNHGSIGVIDQTTGCITYTPDSNYVGVDTICIIVCDTIAGMCDTTLIPITVVPVIDTVLDTIPEGGTITLCPPAITQVDVLGSMDSLCPPMHGTMVLDTTTGCVTYTPDTNFSGTDTLCFVKCDTAGVCDTTSLIITVTPVIDTIPLITNEDVPVSVGQPTLSGVTPATVDTLVGDGPDFGTIIVDTTAAGVPTGTITYVPDTNYVGFDTVTIVTCDASGVCDTTVVFITVLPVMDTTPVTTLEDSSFVLCPGTDSTTTVRNFGTVVISCGPTHADTLYTDPITGCVTYEAGENYVGQDTICIVICDTVAGMCDTTLVPITIEPVRDTVIETITEGDSITLCPPAITVVDVLGTMDSLCPPMNGIMTLDTVTGCVKYVPGNNFAGTDTMCFVKCDTAGVCDTTTLIISVTPERDTISLITNEDVPVSVGQPILSGITPVDTVSYLLGPNHGTIAIDTTPAGVPTGTITYTPDPNYIGFDTVTVVTCNATPICDTTVVFITVLPVLDTLPVTIPEDDSIALCPNGLLTGVTNIGTTTILCGPNHGARTHIDPVTGCVTYVPDSSYVGVDTLCIVICDTVAGMCDTTFVPITIVPVRDTIIEYMDEDDTAILCVPKMTDVDSLSTMIILCGPSALTATASVDTTNGCLTYNSATNYVGFDTVCVVKCDVNGVCDTTVVIIITGPVFDTIRKTTMEDVPLTICPPELSNLGGVITSITTYCGPSHGKFDSVITTGCITYTPDTNYVGLDTICIVTCDSIGNCDTTIVAISVIPVRDTVPLTVKEEGSITLCPRTDSTTDADIISTVIVNCGPNFGTVSTPDPITGCVTYIPNLNFVGADTICIVVTDTNGFSDTSTYPITVIPVRDTLFDTLSSTPSLTWCPPSITVVDSLGTMDSLCPPMYGAMTFDTINGCVTYTRDSAYAGNDTLCFVKCDVAGICDTTTVILTVNRIFAPFDVMDDSICSTDCLTLVSDTMQPGVIYRVHSPVGTIIGRLSTPTVVCPTTDSTFYIEAWDTITGVASVWDTMTVFVTTFMSPGVSSSFTICETGSIVNLIDSLGGTPDTTGTWTDPLAGPFGTGYLGSYNPLTDTSGVYTYTVVNPVCPDTSATITITKSVAPNAGMFDSISLCQNGSLNDLFFDLQGTPDNGGVWSGPVATTNGDLGTLDPLVGIPGRGKYVYTVSKIGCADDTSFVQVWIDTIEDAGIRMDRTSLCKSLESAQVIITGATGGTFSTNADPSDNLFIDPTTGLLTFSNRLPFETRSGVYEVYYTTSGPCPETDTITIDMKVYGDGCQVEIPQFISPNGDGKNDVLHIPGVEEFPNNVLRIFNRWGNVVYEKQAYDNSWNGTANVNKGVNRLLGDNTKLPVGTYFYIFDSGDERYPAFTGYVYVR